MDNTLRVAEQVDLRLEFDQLRLPDFPVPDGDTPSSWLRKACDAGLAERYGERLTETVRHRLDYELGIIDRMGYSGVLPDRRRLHPIRPGAGDHDHLPGSAPGAIVTYSLGITPVDPIAYGLPFERFLNPDRVTMPDIDIDFQDSRRDEVIDYVTRKYGDDRVAQIITFGTLGREGRHPGRGARDGPDLRGDGPRRQGGAQRAQHQPRAGDGNLAAAARADRRGRPCGPVDRNRATARGRQPTRLDARRGDRHHPASR